MSQLRDIDKMMIMCYNYMVKRITQSSEQAMNAVRRFEDQAGLGTRYSTEAALVTEIIGAYSDGLSQYAMDAAALSPLEQIVREGDPELRRLAGAAFNAYLRGSTGYIDVKSGTYLSTILGGLKYDQAAARDPLDRVHKSGIPIRDESGRIPPDNFTSLKVGPNIPLLGELSRESNTATLLIAASRALAHSVKGLSISDDEAFRKSLESKFHYARIIEIFGLHAFEMAIRGMATVRDLERAGRYDILDVSRHEVNKAKEINPYDLIKAIFGHAPDRFEFEVRTNESLGDALYTSHPLAEFYEEFPSSKHPNEIKLRRKHVGSFADKLINGKIYSIEKDRYKLPSDAIGLLATLPSPQAVAEFMNFLVKRVAVKPDIRVAQSTAKDKLFYAQGSTHFLRQLKTYLDSDIFVESVNLELKDTDKEPMHSYQVIKLYLEYEGTSIEFQVQTHDDRHNARLGNVPHMNHTSNRMFSFKDTGVLATVPGKPDDLAAIYALRNKIPGLDSSHTVNDLTIGHAKEFLNSVQTAERLPVG